MYIDCSCCSHDFCVQCDETISDYLSDKIAYQGYEASAYEYCPCYLIHGSDEKNFPKSKKCLSGKEIYDLIYPLGQTPVEN